MESQCIDSERKKREKGATRGPYKRHTDKALSVNVYEAAKQSMSTNIHASFGEKLDLLQTEHPRNSTTSQINKNIPICIEDEAKGLERLLLAVGTQSPLTKTYNERNNESENDGLETLSYLCQILEKDHRHQ